MRKRTNHTAIASILAVGALAAAVVPAGAYEARAAHTLRGDETGRLHLVRASGSLLYEEGPASGPLPGHMTAHLNVGATFTGSFTIYTRGGSMVGHGTATPHSNGRYKSFAGTLVLTGGSGRYVHAHGRAGLYGTFDQRTDSLVIQTTGSLTY
jgi:hypothetical protein